MALHLVPPTPVVEPTLTVRSLAKVMFLPAWAQADELRDQKFPRAGGGKQRVPYYQSALHAIRTFIEAGCDTRVLASVIDDLEARLHAVEHDEETPDQFIAKVRHNLRLLEHIPTFTRIRETSSGVQAVTRKLRYAGIEIRSTPDLLVHHKGISKYVFIHTRADDCDEEEARRMLELAHWVESDIGDGETPFANFEYWILSENRVLKWSSVRKRTISRAKKSLPILLAAWEKVEPPKAWNPAVAREVRK